MASEAAVSSGQNVADKEVIQLDIEPAATNDAELTDISDSDADLANANSALPPVKRKKRGAKEAKKEKERSKAAKAAGAKTQAPVQKLAKR